MKQRRWPVPSIRLACVLTAALGLASHGTAASISVQGQLSDENSVQAFLLTIPDPGGSTIVVRSFGYGGGVNGALQTISSGSFAPSLTLYTTDAAAFPQLVAQDALGGTVIPGPPADSCSNGAGIDTSTSLCLDAVLNYTATGPGTYILKLSLQGNDGPLFLNDPYPGSLPPGFLDPFGNARTNAFALDISGATVDFDTPEPSQALLILASLAAIAAAKLRSNRSEPT